MFKRLRSSKGSAEVVAFILILPFLLLPIFNTVNMLRTLLVYDVLRQVGREAILQMEIDGGLRADELIRLKDKLISRRLVEENLHVHYTPYPVDYGKEVKLSIHYIHPFVTYSIGLRRLERNEETIEMVFGPVSSISKKYFR